MWTALALFAGGLFTGALSMLAGERVWVWRRMGIEEFAVDFRRSVKRADPAMPILGVTFAIGTAGLAWSSEGTRQTLLLAALAPQVIIFVGSLVLAEPINSRFRRLREGEVPAGAGRLRARWRRLHLARTVLGWVAFACVVGAVAQA